MKAAEKPASARVTIQPEWAPHKAMWTAWPSHADLWLEDLAAARAQVAGMVRALAAGEPVRVLACGDDAVKSANAMLGGAAEIIPAAFGDIWLRDTGPIFAAGPQGAVALRFGTNGWGGKYDYPEDRVIGDFIAQKAGAPVTKFDFILEGGSLENDGEGTILTTKECLLNPNRNPGWTQAQIEQALRDAFGAEKILWLNYGLLNDHTDGHIDNIARFVGPGRVVCQSPSGKDDPNADVLNQIAADLEKMTDARGRRLEVIRIPSPGLVMGYEYEPVAASHMNFIIGNKAVVVPVYGTDSADAAVAALQKVFPDRKVIGVESTAVLLNGGGSFHCITQQEPA